MSKLAWGLAGVLGGVFVGLTVLRQSETRCCKALATAIRNKVSEDYGAFGVAIGDSLDLWDLGPEFIDFAGAAGGAEGVKQ